MAFYEENGTTEFDLSSSCVLHHSTQNTMVHVHIVEKKFQDFSIDG